MLKGFRFFMALLFMAANSAVFAVHINHDRTGQVVLLPYYTVNNSFISNFAITNTSGKFKAVRVRLLESRMGADLLNFNLYLSPNDIWTASLLMNPDTGRPHLVTKDESCTYPDKTLLQAGIDLENPYSAITDEDLTEGYLEIIEMGDIADGTGPALDGGLSAEIDASGVADGIIDSNAGDRSISLGLLHDAAGRPADCSVVEDAWSEGAISSSAINGFEPGSMSADGVAQDSGDPARPYDQSDNAGLVAPSGGISAYGILINVQTGAAFVQQGVHIDRYTTVAQHYLPDDPVRYRLPSLASGDIREVYVTNAQGDGRKSISLPLTEYDTGALQSISPLPSVPMGSNPLPIALALSADAISSPYLVNPEINSGTDIVLTFPMRKYSIYNGAVLSNDMDGSGALAACTGTLNDGVDDGDTVTLDSLETEVNDYPHNGDGTPCDNVGFIHYASPDAVINLEYYDYEGQYMVVDRCDGHGFPTCMSLPPTTLPRQVNVISVKNGDDSTQSVLGTPTTNVFLSNLEPGFEAGWLTISAIEHYYDYETHQNIAAMTEVIGGIGSEEGIWTGVPVIGFSVMSADIGPAQVGETVELNRSVNRN